jgi:hypothetical protein
MTCPFDIVSIVEGLIFGQIKLIIDSVDKNKNI